MALFRLSFGVYVFIILGMAISRPVANKKGQLMGGVQVLGTFTMWSWTLIGVYGLVTGALSGFEAAGVDVSGKVADTLARAIWVAFEVLTSMSMLICLVVWFVLVPLMPSLISFVPLSAHNLNVLFMVTEMWLNRMPFVRAHVLFSMYYGMMYIVFSWIYCLCTGLVFYFFIDWRKVIVLPGYTVLIAVLYASFAGSRRLSNWIKKDLAEEVPAIRSVSLTSVEPPENLQSA